LTLFIIINHLLTVISDNTSIQQVSM